MVEYLKVTYSLYAGQTIVEFIAKTEFESMDEINKQFWFWDSIESYTCQQTIFLVTDGYIREKAIEILKYGTSTQSN